MTRVPHLSSRLASLGRLAVLLLLAGFITWSIVSVHNDTGRLQATLMDTVAWQHMQYDVAQESSLQRAYWLRPAPLLHAQFYQTARALTEAVDAELRNSDTDNHPITAHVLAQQQAYLLASDAFFQAVQRGNGARATAVAQSIITPLIASIGAEVGAAAQRAEREASADLQTLNDVERVIGQSALIIFTCGLLVITVLSFIQQTYRRRVAEAMQNELMRLSGVALSDSLTELGNHRAFQEALHREWAQARRQGVTVSLALIDIDEFKMLNDQFGHMQGDRVLAKLSAVLRGGRAGDHAFRLGGDEFALILPHTSSTEAEIVLERLRREAEHQLGSATISIGLAASAPGKSEEDLLREQAEAALIEAKRRGRNTVVAFEQIRESASIVSATKVQAVRRLIAEGQVTVAFQPIWDLQRGVVLAYEALTRPAAHYGLAGPLEAFDIAEQIGRAHELDDVCRRAILARAVELPDDALLFLNISPQALDHNGVAGTALVTAVEAAGITPSRVVLEVTERSLARLTVVVREARRLRDLGFRLALDDVGAGNAGLEMLRQLPVDFVKVDRDVVAGAMTDTTARAVLAAIVAFAREAQSLVIAEGIENTAMLDLVRNTETRATGQSGVYAVQGYLLGRPSETLVTATSTQGYRLPTHAA